MASHARSNYKATTNRSAGLNTDFHDAVEAGLPKASEQPSVLRERTSKGLQVASPKLKRLDTILNGSEKCFEAVGTGRFVDTSFTLSFPACTAITTTLPWESKRHLTSAGISFDLDVTNDESVQTLAVEVKKRTEGRLHVFVNNG